MKRILTAIALLLLAAAPSFAGSGKPGLIAGFTSSQMKLSNVDFKSAAGYQVGVAYNQPLLLGFALQPELSYNTKGTTWAEIKSNLSYLEAGLQLQWGVEFLDLVKVYGFAEPFIGYAVNGQIDYSQNTVAAAAVQFATGSKVHDIDPGKMKSRLEYGLGIGAGVNVIKHLQVFFKYFWNFEANDLNEFVEEARIHIEDNSSFNGLVFGVGFFF